MYQHQTVCGCIMIFNVVLAFMAVEYSDLAMDKTLQKKLDSTLKTVPLQSDPKAAELMLARELISLEAAYDRTHLLRQLVLYQETTNDEQFATNAFWLSARLSEKMNIAEKLRATEPLLVHENGHVRRRAQEFIASLFLGPPPVDFAAIALLSGRNANTAQEHRELIRWIFTNDPGGALLGFARSQQLDADLWRQLLFAEHEISDTLWRMEHKFDLGEDRISTAKANLNKLSQNDHWWVRLYVVEIMRQHSNLRNAEVLQRLAKDDNELVRQQATASSGAQR
jgi:hypothetical protein